jgi:hypothetical protein
VRLQVQEHQIEEICCPACHHRTQARFPVRVDAPAQYGPGVQAFAVSLSQFQLLPLERTCEALNDLCQCSLSQATLVNWIAQAASTLQPHQRHQNDTDRARKPSAIFGLKFLQDMKGVPDEITGAYDPKQERWTVQKPAQEQEQRPGTSYHTVKDTWQRTNTGGGRDKDSNQDQSMDVARD